MISWGHTNSDPFREPFAESILTNPVSNPFSLNRSTEPVLREAVGTGHFAEPWVMTRCTKSRLVLAMRGGDPTIARHCPSRFGTPAPTPSALRLSSFPRWPGGRVLRTNTLNTIIARHARENASSNNYSMVLAIDCEIATKNARTARDQATFSYDRLPFLRRPRSLHFLRAFGKLVRSAGSWCSRQLQGRPGPRDDLARGRITHSGKAPRRRGDAPGLPLFSAPSDEEVPSPSRGTLSLTILVLLDERPGRTARASHDCPARHRAASRPGELHFPRSVVTLGAARCGRGGSARRRRAFACAAAPRRFASTTPLLQLPRPDAAQVCLT